MKSHEVAVMYDPSEEFPLNPSRYRAAERRSSKELSSIRYVRETLRNSVANTVTQENYNRNVHTAVLVIAKLYNIYSTFQKFNDAFHVLRKCRGMFAFPHKHTNRSVINRAVCGRRLIYDRFILSRYDHRIALWIAVK